MPHHSLEFDASLSVLPEDAKPSLDDNLIIEGDNLLALKALLPTHTGKIKCIYIDPPYNTGNEQWVYNDNLTQPQFKEWIGNVVGKEGDDYLRHDKWCCMMYPRLCLLKELLCDDGVIFISIDDNEVANLRLIMDEVFGAENVIATFVWKRRSGANDSKDNISVDHEYVVAARRTSNYRFGGVEKEFLNYKNPDDDPRGSWANDNLTCNKTREQRPNLFYKITNPATGKEYDCNPNRVWVFEPNRMQRIISEGKVIWPQDDKGTPQYKRHLAEVRQLNKPVSTWMESLSKGKKPKKMVEEAEQDTVITIETSLNMQGTKELRQLFSSQPFDYPKPVSLIRGLVSQATLLDEYDNSIILDSFAGSGTTGQAVLELNKQDGGNRRFILIQQPYDTKQDEENAKNICRTITAERIKRVIQGTEKFHALSGSFTYAKLSERPLFGSYRELGETLPKFAEIAKYVYYTETSQQWDDQQLNAETGKIGEHNSQSYYLLYRPDLETDGALDTDFLESVIKNDPNHNIVIYCEKLWVHRDRLRKWERDNGKRIRQMLVPFNLK